MGVTIKSTQMDKRIKNILRCYAAGMEFKDKAYGGKWDWLDLLATILGGIVGQMLQLLIFYVLKCVY